MYSSNAKCMKPAYSQALRQVRGVVHLAYLARLVKFEYGPITDKQAGSEDVSLHTDRGIFKRSESWARTVRTE